MKPCISNFRLLLVPILTFAISASACWSRELKSNMTMLEVEKVIGKADRIETVPGKIAGKFEEPTVIRWYYSKFPVNESGKDYGSPGHINFVPLRFTEHDPDPAGSDKLAREYGEQSDTYRTFSYSGSFPTNKEYWHSLGSLDGIPLKDLSKDGKSTNARKDSAR